MAYQELTKEDVAALGAEGAEFLKEYNALVESLNQDIDKLNDLCRKYGLVSVMDSWTLDKETMDKFETDYFKLYNQHSETYDKYMNMKEDFVLKANIDNKEER